MAPPTDEEHPPHAGGLQKQILQRLEYARRGQRAWAFAAHGSTILIIVCSSVAAVLASAKPEMPFIPGMQVTTAVTLLSLAVTVTTAVRTQLGFERKWTANRMTRSALEQLAVGIEVGNPDDPDAKRLAAIIAAHDQAITASS